jgi:aromatic ring-cleaving dioxygenase
MHEELAMPETFTGDAGALPRGPEIIRDYHAHIYYDPASSRDRAARLRERVAVAFPDATLGRWHDALVGPHPQSMYQIAFPPRLLPLLLPWLMLNRDGLTVLVHPGPAMTLRTTPTTPRGSAACCRFGSRRCASSPTFRSRIPDWRPTSLSTVTPMPGRKGRPRTSDEPELK